MEPDFDTQYGVETEQAVEVSELSDFPGRSVSFRYYALRAHLFAEIMALISIEPEEWVFVDVGAGKGRVVLLASDYPFKEIIGLEFAPELHAIMEKNISVFHNPSQKCMDIRAVHTDARTYEFSHHDTIFFFFNPMEASALNEVFAKIKTWHQKYGNRAIVLFVYPQTGNRAEELLRKQAFSK